MREYEFAILHEIDGLQFLVNTEYEHDEDAYKIYIKFWHEEVNGYCTVTLTYKSNNEKGYEEMFDQFKDVDYCKKWIEELYVMIDE